jgi:hypothetical protein
MGLLRVCRAQVATTLFALQDGVPLETNRHAILRGAGPLGAVPIYSQRRNRYEGHM